MKILVVDDSAIARKFLIKSLPKEIEYEIKEAKNGLECLDIYPEFKPALIFLDLTMPEMDGVETLERLKNDGCEAVIYVLTADIQKNTYEKVMELGANKFLKKPPTKETVTSAVLELADFLSRDQ